MTIRYRFIIDVTYDQPDPKEVESIEEELTENVEKALSNDVFRPFGDEHVADVQIHCRRLPTEYEKVIDLPIRETDLSRHLKIVLRKGFNIRKVRELEKLSEARVRNAVSGPQSVRNFGKAGLKELLKWAEDHSIAWKRP